MSIYEDNRARLSGDEWKLYDGQWVALSRDGTAILAAASTLEALVEELSALGKRAEDVALEKVDREDSSYLGGAELH